MAKNFYTPREVYFNRKTARWVIQNLGSLRGGRWPAEVSSYIDVPIGKRTAGRKAPFITPVECAAEISARLEKCRIDGLILLAIECWGESEASLANYLRMQEWSIKKRYKQALAYVASGPARRWHDTKKRGKIYYHEWVKGKRWDSKTRTYYWLKK
ncbi:hypothetical protein ES708_20910 [subsurface metagenome]